MVGVCPVKRYDDGSYNDGTILGFDINGNVVYGMALKAT